MSIWSNKLYFFLKRIVDIVFSIVIIVIFLPVILVVSVVIKMESFGPVLADTPKRVTKIGKFIRKHSLDEVPQLFNVLKGQMSLVGPRPYYPEELEKQQNRYPHTKG